jgi:hypothetical protein
VLADKITNYRGAAVEPGLPCLHKTYLSGINYQQFLSSLIRRVERGTTYYEYECVISRKLPPFLLSHNGRQRKLSCSFDARRWWRWRAAPLDQRRRAAPIGRPPARSARPSAASCAALIVSGEWAWSCGTAAQRAHHRDPCPETFSGLLGLPFSPPPLRVRQAELQRAAPVAACG